MKKITLLLAMMIAGFANAQTLHVSVIDDIVQNEANFFCADTLVIHADSTCFHPVWYRPDESEVLDGVFQLIVSENEHQGRWIYEDSNGANFGFDVYISSPSSNAFNPFDAPFIWKRPGDTITLGNPELDFLEFQWSTGETTPTIDVVDDGTYSVEVNDPCGPRTFSIEVRDNVEITLATCDLESNHNMVIWQTTPEQAEYVSQVEVKRDGLVVGTVPYTDGQFIDNIGSDAASRTYTVTAIATDGTPCPLTSYPKETIHMSYTLGVNNTIELGWNAPTGYDLIGYNICEWNAATNALTAIDFVGAGVTSYTCQESMFDHGNIVVQGVEAGKDGETRLLSNRSWEIVGLGEHEAATFSVYPNPSSGVFTVEGTGTLRVTNMLGQTIKETEIDGMLFMKLPQGLYFITVDEMTRKVVVE